MISTGGYLNRNVPPVVLVHPRIISRPLDASRILTSSGGIPHAPTVAQPVARHVRWGPVLLVVHIYSELVVAIVQPWCLCMFAGMFSSCQPRLWCSHLEAQSEDCWDLWDSCFEKQGGNLLQSYWMQPTTKITSCSSKCRCLIIWQWEPWQYISWVSLKSCNCSVGTFPYSWSKWSKWHLWETCIQIKESMDGTTWHDDHRKVAQWTDSFTSGNVLVLFG